MMTRSNCAADFESAVFSGSRSVAPASSSSRLRATAGPATMAPSAARGHALRLAIALLRVEHDLADPHRRGCHLDAFVLAAELQGLLQRQLPMRDEPHQLVTGG